MKASLFAKNKNILRAIPVWNTLSQVRARLAGF